MSSKDKEPVENKEGSVRASISVRMIRHAESQNNQVYRDARRLFGGGTPDFDQDGWNSYVDQHRGADPGLSDRGKKQSERLADFLVPHLLNQASRPIQFVVSPMRRTLETIRPTLEKITASPNHKESKCHVIVNGFYHESEGCHIREKAEEGMNPTEITSLLQAAVTKPDDLEFEGFPNPSRGWYVEGTGPETRAEAETRAAKFYLWLCEHLDSQLFSKHDDIFDAGVTVEGEESECEHDKISPRQRRRRTALLIGHADFMGLVLKRIVAGFGHFVENEGVPHRSAFVHFNTGITELEYFGNGRFLIMASNQTPHFHPNEHSSLRSGGSLKDGWSYIVPDDEFLLDDEVSVAFADEMEEHVREQTKALHSLYLGREIAMKSSRSSDSLCVEENNNAESGTDASKSVSFVVKRGLQVVGCASYNEQTGAMSDVVIRPSARKSLVGRKLVDAVRQHAKKLGRSGSVMLEPRTMESKEMFEMLGFHELDDAEDVA